MSHEVKACAEHCPWCGEPIELLIDGSVGQQEYIEDCEVCCRPMMVTVLTGFDGEMTITVANPDA